jgi:CBS domain-containing protein
MATLKDIIATKGSQVWSIDQEATVLEAVHVLNEHRIGAVVVTDHGQFVGIFTERDLLRRVVGKHLDPVQTQVRDVMTTNLICCTPTTSVEEARAIMRDKRIRHLPMHDGAGRLVGMISIGDLNAHLLASQEQTIHVLHEYLYGRV